MKTTEETSAANIMVAQVIVTKISTSVNDFLAFILDKIGLSGPNPMSIQIYVSNYFLLCDRYIAPARSATDAILAINANTKILLVSSTANGTTPTTNNKMHASVKIQNTNKDCFLYSSLFISSSGCSPLNSPSGANSRIDEIPIIKNLYSSVR